MRLNLTRPSPPVRIRDTLSGFRIVVPLILALLTALPGAGRLAAQVSSWPSALPGGDAVALTGVRVFDGESVLEDATVILRDGRIAAVGVGIAPSDGATVVNGAGHTLLPGFIDAHTHTFDRESLTAALGYGVTTELDQFTMAGFAAQMRAEQDDGPVTDRADLFSAGILATRAGGHGTQYGLDIPTVASAADAPAFVAARKAEGSDWLKIIWEDGSSWGMATPTHDPETVQALIDAGRAEGLMPVIHIARVDHAVQASEMGVAGLVHAPADTEPGPDFGATLARNGTFMVPTLTVNRSIATGEEGDLQLADERLAVLADGQARASLGQAFPLRQESARAYEHAATATASLQEAGGLVLAGTDAPNPGTAHGLSMHREVELLVDAGLSPTEALAAATAHPAQAFGLDDRGRIAPGLRADLLLVEGDPTARITDTRNLVAVWRNGAALVPEAPQSMAVAPGSGTASEAPVPGPVSDFEDGRASSAFGSGWMTSTDRMAGGTSVAELSVVDGALRVEGEVKGSGFSTWSGGIFFPGPGAMAPTDLSAGTGLRFRVRGQGPSLTVMMFSQSSGPMPSFVGRTMPTEWTTVEIPFAHFQGTDLTTANGIFFGVAGQAGPYWLELDDVGVY